MSVEEAFRLVDERNSSRNWSPTLRLSGTRLQLFGTSFMVVVVPVPLCDQLPSPSALVARTCTRYGVPGVRLPMLSLVAVTSCGPSVQPLAPCTLYRRS